MVSRRVPKKASLTVAEDEASFEAKDESEQPVPKISKVQPLKLVDKTKKANGVNSSSNSMNKAETDLLKKCILRMITENNQRLIKDESQLEEIIHEMKVGKTEFLEVIQNLIISDMLYRDYHETDRTPNYSQNGFQGPNFVRSSIMVKSTMALSIQRFLNYLCDNISFKLQQKKISLNAALNHFKIPEWVIQIRNDISHYEMPEISQLIRTIDFCLNYVKFYSNDGVDSSVKDQGKKSEIEDAQIDFEYLVRNSRLDTLVGYLEKFIEVTNKSEDVTDKAKNSQILINKICSLIADCNKRTTLKAFFLPSTYLLDKSHLESLKSSLKVTDTLELAKVNFNSFMPLLKSISKYPNVFLILCDMMTEKVCLNFENLDSDVKAYQTEFLDKLLFRIQQFIDKTSEYIEQQKSYLVNIMDNLMRTPDMNLSKILRRHIKSLLKREIFTRDQIDPPLKIYTDYLNCVSNAAVSDKTRNQKKTSLIAAVEYFITKQLSESQ